MANAVIFLNPCFTNMSSPEIGNLLLVRLLRGKGTGFSRPALGDSRIGCQGGIGLKAIHLQAVAYHLYQCLHENHYCEKTSARKSVKANLAQRLVS